MTAAAARKLQKDIEVVLKKVDDGLEEFSEAFDQAVSAPSAQRDKLGEELKKSINKLQRFRSQIREWIAQSDVKCKDKLEDSRKRIENDMQRFKDFERDLKTKAFSSIALSKTDDLELEEMEKQRNQEWLASTIQALNDQLDEFEADVELLTRSSKSLSNDEKSRQAQLRTLQERHRWHINKLELCLRALDNESLDVSDLAIVRDSVDMYIENHGSTDTHDETLYDCFDLTEFEEKRTITSTSLELRDSIGSREEPKGKNKDKDKRNKKDDKKDKKKDAKDTVKSPLLGSVNKTALISSPLLAMPSSPSSEPKADPKEKRLLDDINLDEEKVQEDQLISEAEEFICKICQIHVVGCSPKLTNCSHLFCGDCIAQWFAQHPESQTWAQRAKTAGPDRVVPCPVCKQPLNEKKDLYPVCGATSRSENLLLWRMLSSLKIMCVNHVKVRADGKCPWIGEYGQYQKHIASCLNKVSIDSLPVQPAPRAESRDLNSPLTSAAHTPQIKPAVAPAVPAPTAAAPVVAQAPVKAPKAAPEPPKPAPAMSPAVAAAIQQPGLTPPAAPSRQQPPKTPAMPATPATPASQVPATAPATAASAPAAPATSLAPPSEDAKASGEVSSPMVQAASAFESTGPNMLSLQAGELLQVLERHASGWSYCRSVSRSSEAGWVPSWVVQATPQGSKSPTAPAVAAAPKEAPIGAASRRDSEALRPKQPQVEASQTSKEGASSTLPASMVPAAPKAPHAVVRAASAAFTATSASQLTLAQNDLVEIIERHSSGWTFGRKVNPGASAVLEGWFPDWVCGQK